MKQKHVTGFSLAYEILWGATKRQEEAAACLPKSSPYFQLTAMVMCAFTVEAYVNHLGEVVDPTVWAGEKSFFGGNTNYRGVKGKFVYLAEKCGYAVDWSRTPHQTIAFLLKLRDSVAHGRTDWFDEDVCTAEDGFPLFVKSKFDKAVSHPLAARSITDTHATIIGLNEQARRTFPNMVEIMEHPLMGFMGYQSGEY